MSRQERVVMKVTDDESDDGIGVLYKQRSRGFNYKAAFFMVSLLLTLAVGFMSGYFVAENSVPPQPNLPNNAMYYGNFGEEPWSAAGGNDAPRGLDPCASRQCCVALESAAGAQACNGYDVTTCLAHSECDWDCDARASGRRSQRAQGHRKTYKGKGQRGGEFRDFQDFAADPATGNEPTSWEEYQEDTRMVGIDECDDMFEEDEDDETAQQEFGGLGQRQDRDMPSAVPFNRRLVQIGTNDQHRVTSKAGVESVVGLLTFEDGSGSTYWCTATKVSKKHLITAGHCCGDGKGNWYTNWNWYPSAISFADRDSITPAPAGSAWTFSKWFSEASFDWDMCVLTLTNPTVLTVANSYMGYGWNTGLSTSWVFDYSGYPVSLADNTGIKWGETQCPLRTVLTEQLKYQCDTGGGQSGMSIYKTGTYTVYCVHSWGNSYSAENGCCRFTETKFNAVYAHINGAGGYA